MKIKKFISQNRRDFHAIYICEYCGNEEKGTGYDDTFFHQSVVPKMKCKKCGKQANENYRAFAPRYEENEII